MFNKQKALDTARANLARQQATLKETLDELDFVQSAKPSAIALITKLRVKRDRQANLVKSTEDTIELYSEPITKKR